jgi:hypothetical protein
MFAEQLNEVGTLVFCSEKRKHAQTPRGALLCSFDPWKYLLAALKPISRLIPLGVRDADDGTRTIQTVPKYGKKRTQVRKKP